MNQYAHISMRFLERGLPWTPGMLVRHDGLLPSFRIFDQAHANEVNNFHARGLLEGAYPDMNDLATIGCIEQWLVALWRNIGGTVSFVYPATGGQIIRVRRDAQRTGGLKEFNGNEYPHVLYTAVEEVFLIRESQAAEALERTRRRHADGELP